MTYETPGAPALDYQPCRYGPSKLLFRGPRQDLRDAYFAAIGGSETYGRFVAEPFPALLQARLGRTVVNFGCMNAGVDVFVNEPTVIQACRKARATVVQVVGAHNMTNRFYAVHPRRNDRFLRASPLMRQMFSDIDFAEYNFTRHMLRDLKNRAPERFLLIETELRDAWVARMRNLLARLGPRTILLWLGDHHPRGRNGGLGPDPLLVDGAMIDDVGRQAAHVVHVEPSDTARAAGLQGMVHSEFDTVAAAEMPGPAVHAEIAEALEPVLKAYL
jgi:hypothetical protein